MRRKSDRVLVVLHSHPELYPPTLNAIANLSDHYKEVHVLYKPHKKDEWSWPANVRLHPAAGLPSVRAFMQSSSLKRLKEHFRFIMSFLALILRLRPGIILLYDPYPALFYRLIHPFLFLQRHFLWYHNHDVIESNNHEEQSRMVQALSRAERWIIGRADLFTLPAVERKAFFDLGAFKGHFFTLPNFPSKKVFSSLPFHRIGSGINVAFQGSICPGRGLEGMISLMPLAINEIPVRFFVTGFCNNDSYLRSLKDLQGTQRDDAVLFREAVAYGRLSEALRDAHIGWVYYGMDSSMDHSMGTASNKFFECCAMGLPVLYNEQNSFEIYQTFKWAIPVALTKESIMEKLNYIVENYAALSSGAYRQFREELNFERAFENLLNLLPPGKLISA
jgi:hypothetical protein